MGAGQTDRGRTDSESNILLQTVSFTPSLLMDSPCSFSPSCTAQPDPGSPVQAWRGRGRQRPHVHALRDPVREAEPTTLRL